MRSYGQHCGLARALDIVGDRWTLLIVRELMILGPARYTDLQKGLPGIATNLLADRLRELEEAGVVRRNDAPPPIATVLFGLTARGLELEPVLAALGRWGAPLLTKASARDKFQPHWLALPLRLYLRDASPEQPPLQVHLRMGGESIALETRGDGGISTRMGAPAAPHITISGRPDVVLNLLTKKISAREAPDKRIQIDGDPAILDRLILSVTS